MEDWYHSRIYLVFLRFKQSVIEYVKKHGKAHDAIEKELDQAFHQKHFGKTYFQVKKTVITKLLTTSVKWFTTTAYPSNFNPKGVKWPSINTSIGLLNILPASQAYFQIPKSEQEYQSRLHLEEFHSSYKTVKRSLVNDYLYATSREILGTMPKQYGAALQFFHEMSMSDLTTPFYVLVRICVTLIRLKKFDLAKAFLHQYKSILPPYQSLETNNYSRMKHFLDFSIAMRDKDLKKAFERFSNIKEFDVNLSGFDIKKSHLLKELFNAAISAKNYEVASGCLNKSASYPDMRFDIDKLLKHFDRKKEYIEALSLLDSFDDERAPGWKKFFVLSKVKDQETLCDQIISELKSNPNFVVPRFLFYSLNKKKRLDLIAKLCKHFKMADGEIFPKIDERPEIIQIVKAQILANDLQKHSDPSKNHAQAL